MSHQGWDSLKKEAIEHLQRLIRFDTSNPPGNEREAANYIRDVLKAEGIDAEVLESEPRRASVIAELAGDGSKQPLLLLSHIDVVPAQADAWSVPPFSGEMRDGYLWGRGTLDTKGFLTMELMAMILAKRQNLPLKRDIKLAALADEECGGGLGAEWLTENHYDKLSAEFAINEGGHAMRSDKGRIYMIATAEKGVCWAVLTAKGRAGHGSIPHDDNAVVKIAEAVRRLARHRSTVRITRTVSRFIAEACKYDSRLGAFKFASWPVVGRYIMGKSPDGLMKAMVRNTFAPTVVRGGSKVNIIPDACTMEVDSRILPGVTRDDWLREMKGILGDVPVDIELKQFNEATESELDTELYTIVKKSIKECEPEAVVAPFMVPGATDSRFFRARGMVSYGIMPFAVTQEEIETVHGVDERISLEAFERGLRITYDIVRRLCT